ncbi:fasciclin domain-containing protein [Sphingomonas sp. Leaf343]|uniref:fasciclin domain-containing protein n=1 Tax=Sphingomonas sp. Leaf343 TaxID=1736345 RepID=UPI0009E90792|nr:fasciclin domain-containing protein [Sphingomonas sp. Leaf343]
MFHARTPNVLAILAAGTALIATPALAGQKKSKTADAPQVAVGRTPMTAPVDAAPAENAPVQTAQVTPGQVAPAQPAEQAAPAQAAPAAPAAAPAPAATTTIAAALPTLPNHATLLKLVTAAKLEAQLAGPGPFTVFAPDDAAFSRLPAGTLDAFLAPANAPTLATILKNHVVAGSMDEAQIRAAITAGGGRATIPTLSGQPLIATIDQGSVLLTDAVGNKSYIDKPDLRQTNGVIHSTNGISLPKIG